MSYQEEGQIRLRRLRSKQAIALAMEGRWREAVTANQNLLENFPNDVDAYNRLGRAYMELGEYSRAREAYGRALELDPYNTIAEKNLRRLSRLRAATVSPEDEPGKVEPQQFIEETGKAGVVSLDNLASAEVLAGVVAGDKVNLRVDGFNLVVESGRGEYLGQVESRHGQRLSKLIEGGNKYTANIVSVTEDTVTVIIREEYRHPSQAEQLSFPTRGIERPRSYAVDRMLRRELEREEESAEEPGFTIINEDGEVLFDGFLEVEDDVESEE